MEAKSRYCFLFVIYRRNIINKISLRTNDTSFTVLSRLLFLVKSTIRCNKKKFNLKDPAQSQFFHTSPPIRRIIYSVHCRSTKRQTHCELRFAIGAERSRSPLKCLIFHLWSNEKSSLLGFSKLLKYKLFVSRRPLLNETHKEWEDFNVRKTTPLLTAINVRNKCRYRNIRIEIDPLSGNFPFLSSIN